MKKLCLKIMSLPLWLRGIVVTLLAFLISWIAVYDLMSVSFFSPMEKAADFRFSDFYTLVANDRAVKTLHPSIVIVAVDGCNRREIAATLDDINYCMPAATGLDIAFSVPRDTLDEPLAEAIASFPGIILPVFAKETADGDYTILHQSYYDRFAPDDALFAAVNIEGEKEARFTVREFLPLFPSTAESGAIPSLSYALVAKASPGNVDEVSRRGFGSEALRYASREFEILSPDEILDNQEMIEGKIVIVGKVRDAGDLHSTPLDNFTPGVLIHACAAATILDGDFTRRLTPGESWLIAAVACYLVVLLSLYLASHTLGDLIVRGIQLAALYLMILTGTLMYTRFNIDLDFANAMLMTSLGVVACDLFNGIFADDGILVLGQEKIHGLIIHTKHITNEFYKKYIFKSVADSSANDDGSIARP